MRSLNWQPITCQLTPDSVIPDFGRSNWQFLMSSTNFAFKTRQLGRMLINCQGHKSFVNAMGYVRENLVAANAIKKWHFLWRLDPCVDPCTLRLDSDRYEVEVRGNKWGVGNFPECGTAILLEQIWIGLLVEIVWSMLPSIRVVLI